MESLTLLPGYKSYTCKTKKCSIYFKGSIHIRNERVDTDSWANSLLQKLSDENLDFADFILSELKQISGLYSLIITDRGTCYLATDIIRSFPVFYGLVGGDMFITDNLDAYQNRYGVLPTDEAKLEEYVSTGYVFGNGTIYRDTYAVQAGEMVIADGKNTHVKKHFEFKPSERIMDARSIDNFTDELDQVLLDAFTRMLEQTPAVNRWVIPLSGGHDSRLIVNYLRRLGLDNVICYTYGTAGNEQSGLSKQVAQALGYEWHFVEYTEQKWEELHKKGIIEEYLKYATNGVSTPHLQDFLAVYKMKEEGILKPNDVLIPGHTLDWLAGSILSDLDLQCQDEAAAVDRVISVHTSIQDLSSSPAKRIAEIYQESQVLPQHFQEYFNWKERRTKLMTNSLRCYEFFGFEFRLPYWDKELAEFWREVPHSQRAGRKAFFLAEKSKLLDKKLLSIPFFGKCDKVTKDGIVEKAIKALMPMGVKSVILRLTGRKSEFNAGLNQIYALRATKAKEILRPVKDYPRQTHKYFKKFLNRFPYQIDYHFLTGLYTLRIQFDRKNGGDKGSSLG